MKQILLTITIVLVSCGSSNKTVTKRYSVDKRTTNNRIVPSRKSQEKKSYNKRVNTIPKKTVQSNNSPSIADKVIWTAVTYKGTPYRYGGTTKKGMDCSGLIYTSFLERGIELPRTSIGLYEKSSKIKLGTAQRGDLLFFKTTNNNRNIVNHVGIVVSNDNKGTKFIHSTSSRGVIISDISESYWKKSFIQAKRVLN